MAKKMKKHKEMLLVATDFTTYSEEAMIFAGNLAYQLDAQLLVLHIIHDPAEAPGFYVQKQKKKRYLRTMEDAADEMMAILLDKVKKTNPEHNPSRMPHRCWSWEHRCPELLKVLKNGRSK